MTRSAPDFPHMLARLAGSTQGLSCMQCTQLLLGFLGILRIKRRPQRNTINQQRCVSPFSSPSSALSGLRSPLHPMQSSGPCCVPNKAKAIPLPPARKCAVRVTTEEASRVQQELSSANSTFRADSNARVAPIPICKSCFFECDALALTILKTGM